MLLVGLAMFGVFFYNSLFIQNVLGYSAVQTGRVLPADDRADHPRRPARGEVLRPGRLALADRRRDGPALALASSSSRASTRPPNFWDILPGLLVGGFGMALVMTPTTAAAMGSVPVDKAGVGSAVLNSMRQVGGSLGIAVIGAIVAAVRSSVPLASPLAAGRFVTGYQHALTVAALIALAGAVLSVATVRKYRHADQPVPEAA